MPSVSRRIRRQIKRTSAIRRLAKAKADALKGHTEEQMLLTMATGRAARLGQATGPILAPLQSVIATLAEGGN